MDSTLAFADSGRQAYAKLAGATLCCMATDAHDVRLARLQEIIDTRYGGRDKGLQDAGALSMSMLGQWRSRNRTFGERAARKIEAKLSLRPYYLEGDDYLTPQARMIGRWFDDLSETRRQKMFEIIQALIGPAASDERVESKMPITSAKKIPRLL